jgi:hypothetical protein
MTPDQSQALADRTAQELLAMSWAEAVVLLECGEFDGTGVEPTLRGIKRLLDA